MSCYDYDWFIIISDLKKKYTLLQLEEKTNIPYTTIHNWKQGGEPKHSKGEKLISLWCEVTGKSRNELPVVNMMSYHFKSC